MKEIKLTRGLKAQVDDKNYNYLNQWKWCTLKVKNTYYAVRRSDHKFIYMHRVIMDTPANKEVDHQDLNGLNCQEYNMRNCTHGQNGMNRNTNGKSKYKGVTISLEGRKTKRIRIKAQIMINYKHINLGDFKTEEMAARAYDEAAKKYHKEFAYLNFK